MIASIHPVDPEPRVLRRAVEVMEAGGIVVCPTDTVYAYVCDCGNARGIERIARLKGVKPKNAELSLICHDISQLSLYARAFSTPVFRVMKQVLPGPYTFILPASNEIARIFGASRRNVGIRIPDHAVPLALAKALGRPLAAASVHDPDGILDHPTDPERIHARLAGQVELMLDAGAGGMVGSTVIDASADEPRVIRQGVGPIDGLF